MRTRRRLVAGILAITGMAMAVQAGDLTIENRVQVKYDDNIRFEEEGAANKTESLRLTEELTVSGSMRLDNAFLSMRYQGKLNWYENREEDDLDVNHTLDFIWNHVLSQRFSFSVMDTFRQVELPELILDDGTIQRQDSSYVYNTVRGAVTTTLTPSTRLDVSGRYVLARYDEDWLAERDDYDLYAAGTTLRGRVTKNTMGFVDLRAESIEYVGARTIQPGDIYFPGAEQVRQREVPDRGADTFSGGIGIDRVFGPSFVGVLRGGVTHKKYEAANTEDRTHPYADASMTYSVSPTTRVTLGLSHQLFQSSMITYVNQTRNAADLRLAHDVNSRFRVTLYGRYIQSEYERDESVDTFSLEEARDGTEDAKVTGLRLAYKLSRDQWLEAGWSYRELDSEIRDKYRRNIVDASWRVRL